MLAAKLNWTAGVVLAAGVIAIGVIGWSHGVLADEPAKNADADRIDKLIEQLGSAKFSEREAASKELEKIGVPALDALQKAAKSTDLETRRRAQSIIAKVRRGRAGWEVSQPTRLHLVYKDTPLEQAVADFGKKSGGTITLLDPDDKLSNRKVTLDTGDTTFWQAFDKFCRAAGLVEAGIRETSIASEAMPALALKDGKPGPVPTEHVASLRVRGRTVNQIVLPGAIADDELALELQFSVEPRAWVYRLAAFRLDKVLDDQGQAMTEAMQGDAKPGAARNASTYGPHLVVPLLLKQGTKQAKALKEVKGTLTIEVVTAPQPLITVDNLLKAAAKTFDDGEGGSLKVVEIIKNDDEVKARLRLVPPESLKAAARAKGVLTKPPQEVEPEIKPKGLANAQPTSDPDFGPGMALLDAKGKPVKIDVERVKSQGGEVGSSEYIVTFDLPKEQETVKLVFSGSRLATIETPFTLKNMPLP
jgi:hypothetical protein